MTKLNPLGLGVASGATTAVLYLICSFFFGFYPELAVKSSSYLLHGIEAKIVDPITLASFFVGLIVWFLVAFVLGAVFAWVYNLFAK